MPPVLSVVKMVADTVPPLHTVTLGGWLTCPVGLAVMVKILLIPSQYIPPFSKVGVTSMVATFGEVPVLLAMNEVMVPVPEVAASPMVGSLLVHA